MEICKAKKEISKHKSVIREATLFNQHMEDSQNVENHFMKPKFLST